MTALDSSPVDVVRYDHVIRLTRFRPTGAMPSRSDIERFVAAWKASNAVAAVQGILYRELCRQMPERSALVDRETDYPIAADFLEYVIAEPEVDLDAIAALPAPETDGYQTSQDLFRATFRFVRQRPGPASRALLVNLFEIDGPAALEQAFVMDWASRGPSQMNEPAIRSTMLHHRMTPHATIKAFDRVEIVGPDADAYVDGIDRFDAGFPHQVHPLGSTPGGPPSVRRRRGLFEIVAVSPPGTQTEHPDMSAVVLERYGESRELTPQKVRRPEPGPHQVRIKVRATAINELDTKMRSGDVRHIYPPWFPDVLGFSVAGTVDAIGRGVSDLTVGQEVYGLNNPIMRHGYADYVVGPARNFYPKPPALDFASAAAAPPIFATAYGALFLRTNLQPGQTVLIHGGTGGVGSCAVQLAKQAGAVVLATGSKNLERLKTLGCDVVINYRTERFEDFAHDVDVVLDTVGGETRERSWPLIRRGGILATLVPPPPDQTAAERHGVHAFMVHGHPDIGEIMPEMTRRLQSGELQPPTVTTRFALAQAAEAHRVSENDSPPGRIVLIPEAGH